MSTSYIGRALLVVLHSQRNHVSTNFVKFICCIICVTIIEDCKILIFEQKLFHIQYKFEMIYINNRFIAFLALIRPENVLCFEHYNICAFGSWGKTKIPDGGWRWVEFSVGLHLNFVNWSCANHLFDI